MQVPSKARRRQAVIETVSARAGKTTRTSNTERNGSGGGPNAGVGSDLGCYENAPIIILRRF